MRFRSSGRIADGPSFYHLALNAYRLRLVICNRRRALAVLLALGTLLPAFANPRYAMGAGAGALRVRTAEPGLYRLTYDDLVAAGVPVTTTDPALFAMSYLGEPIDVQVTGEDDGHFDSGDAVIFYAEPYHGRYMNHNVYWFSYGGEPGARMAVREAAPIGNEPAVNSITQTLHVEFDRDYRSRYTRPRDADHWFDTQLYANSTTPTAAVTYTLALDDPVPSGDLLLRALLHGGTDQPPDPDQSVQIRFNDHVAGTFQWDGETDYVATATLPASWLDPTSNQVVLEAGLAQFAPDHGMGYYWISPDWVELTYPARAEAESDRIYVEGIPPGAAHLAVSGFSSDDVRVYDVRDGRHPVQLVAVEVEGTGADYTAHVWDDHPASYFLSTEAALRQPLAVEVDEPSNWRSAGHTHDYIAIVHPALEDAIQPLLDRRASEGFRVAKVNVQDIYDEFSYGRVDPEAIRSFLSYAYHKWNQGEAPPQYVLLVGDGHYDFTGVSGTTLPNLVPPYLVNVDPWLGETAADNRYVSVDGPDDYLPDMHVGRIPARDAADITAVVDKIIAYESTAPAGDWQRRVVFVADAANDPAADFHRLSDDVRQNWLPPAYADRTIYYREDEATGEDMRSAIKDAFDDGPLLVQWFGHASRFRWGSVSMFNIFDLPDLAPNTRWPVSMTYACWSGYFVSLHNDWQTLGETLLLAPERGSVAALSPAGLHVGSALKVLNQGIVQAIFQDRIQRLGEAVDAGKYDFYTHSPAWHDVIDTFTLFGDPALKLRLPAMPRLKNSRFTVSDETPAPGAQLTFTITIVNDGNADAEDLTVTVDYDAAWLTVDEATGALNDGGRLTWAVGTLPPGITTGAFTATLNPIFRRRTTVNTTAVISARGQLDVTLGRPVEVPATPNLSTLYLPLALAGKRGFGIRPIEGVLK